MPAFRGRWQDASAGTEDRGRLGELAFEKLIHRLGIGEAVQDLERLADLDVEGLPHELGIEAPVKRIMQLKRLFGIA